jgi:glycosyltransferase involved in cell wall biosynthesis
MPRLIAAGEYDYAHFQYIRPLLARARVIVTMHDALVLSHPRLFKPAFVARNVPLFLASAHASDVLMTVSEFSRDEISRRMLVRKARVHIVPNGVSDRYFDRRESARQAELCRGRHGLGRYIVYVSRFERRKNQHGLVRAWVDAGLPERGITLLLVGSNRQAYPELKAEIDRLPAQTAQLLKILEGVSDAELQGLVSGSQGFAYPSLAEGFGIPPLEAVAMQVPVICSNRTAMRDYDFLGDDLFDPADHPAMVDRLQRMIASPPEPRFLVRRAEAVRQRYTWQSVASRFLQVLREDSAFSCRRDRRHRSNP